MSSRRATPACNAPFTSMNLDPRGNVRACCMNEYQSLGRIGEASLREIWDGQRLADLRTHLGAADFSLGCEECELAVRSGVPGAAYLTVFDRLTPSGPSPVWPQQLEMALTNTCNLQCGMCNGDLSSSIRSQREGRPPLPTVYTDQFFEELGEFLLHAQSIIMLGGEPFLGREPMRVFEMMLAAQLAPQVHVTTNGTIYNARVQEIIAAFPIHVAVSIDAISTPLASQLRVGVDQDVVLNNVDSIRNATAAPGKSCSIAFCLMRQNWHEFGTVLEWAEQRDLPVFVNQVASPPAFSLRHAPTAELEDISRGLQGASRRVRGLLTKNLEVWDRELSLVTTLLDNRRSSESKPVTLGPRATLDGVVPALTDAWLRAQIEADEDQIVRVADGDQPATGIPFASLIGRSLQDLVPMLQASLGPTTSSRLRLHAGDIEERHLTFSSAGVTTQVRAFLLPGPHNRWALRVLRSDGVVNLADKPAETA